MRNLFYFGLEPLKSRYTYQLSQQWIPATFKNAQINFINIPGDYQKSKDIKIGNVLDATGRGKFAMTQCINFLEFVEKSLVKNNDIIYLQDFFHPGIESVLYALDLYNIKVKIYSMLHAQSVDEYDFTWKMRKWLRHHELSLDRYSAGIFVGSTIHRNQLREAGFESNIHVVSLPFHSELALQDLNLDRIKKTNCIIYCSRLDKEKNPFFLKEFITKFLSLHPDWTFYVTTSGSEFRSSLPNAVNELRELSDKLPNFKFISGLTKTEYYQIMASAKILFNCSLQDYVSWTVLEASLFGCDLLFPEFRSFPEFIPKDRMYLPFNLTDALNTANSIINSGTFRTYNFHKIADVGREMERYIMLNDIEIEYNVWHELELCKYLINQ